MIWHIISDMCSCDKTAVRNQTSPERLAENTIRQNPGKLKTISHRNPAEKPFEVDASGWGLYPVFQHAWYYFAYKAYRIHGTRVPANHCEFNRSRMQNFKIVRSNMVIPCPVFTVWFHGYGFESHQESLLQSYHMSCQRWRGRWCFCYISLSLSYLSFFYIYITPSFFISFSYCRHLILLPLSLLPTSSDKTGPLLYPFLTPVSFLPPLSHSFVTLFILPSLRHSCLCILKTWAGISPTTTP